MRVSFGRILVIIADHGRSLHQINKQKCSSREDLSMMYIVIVKYGGAFLKISKRECDSRMGSSMTWLLDLFTALLITAIPRERHIWIY